MGLETREKQWCIHAKELYTAIKSHELEIYATMGMNLTNIVLREINQTQKNPYCKISENFKTGKSAMMEVQIVVIFRVDVTRYDWKRVMDKASVLMPEVMFTRVFTLV